MALVDTLDLSEPLSSGVKPRGQVRWPGPFPRPLEVSEFKESSVSSESLQRVGGEDAKSTASPSKTAGISVLRMRQLESGSSNPAKSFGLEVPD